MMTTPQPLRGWCRPRVPDATALDPAEMLERVAAALGAAFERSENVVCDFLSAASFVLV